MRFDIHQAFKKVQLDGAEWFSLRHRHEVWHYRNVRDGKPEQNSIKIDQGVMVEVLSGGTFGYGATNDLSDSGIQRAAEAALQMAQVSAPYKVFKFTTKQRPKVVGEYQTPFKKSFSSLSVNAINDLLIKLSMGLKASAKIVCGRAEIFYIDIEQSYVSSNGSDVNQKTMQIATNLTAIAQEGAKTQKRSSCYFSNCRQMGFEYLDHSRLHAEAEELCRESVELLSADECPSGVMDLVLAPDQMYLQIHESIGHPLEMDRILGDERNYAGWSFVKLSDFGKFQYGSPLLNVTFAPDVPTEMASYQFDDSGTKAQREYIIKEGVLLRGLGGIESQTRSGILGVANSRASSWNRAPIDRMANINIEPGDSSFAELISSTEKGIFMKSNCSWSIDDYRRKFQFGCEYGRLIENGKLTKLVRNPNYRGVSNEFWRNLVGVGDSSTVEIHGSPNCGKGEPNQIMRVGHATPTCRFKDVEVFGGEK